MSNSAEHWLDSNDVAYSQRSQLTHFGLTNCIVRQKPHANDFEICHYERIAVHASLSADK